MASAPAGPAPAPQNARTRGFNIARFTRPPGRPMLVARSAPACFRSRRPLGAARPAGCQDRGAGCEGDKSRRSGIRCANGIGLSSVHGELLLPRMTEVAALPGHFQRTLRPEIMISSPAAVKAGGPSRNGCSRALPGSAGPAGDVWGHNDRIGPGYGSGADVQSDSRSRRSDWARRTAGHLRRDCASRSPDIKGADGTFLL